MNRVLDRVSRTNNKLASKSTLNSKLNLVHVLKLRSKLDERHLIAATKLGALAIKLLASLILGGELDSTASRQVDRRLLCSNAATKVKALKIERLHL